jgi:quinohemoprotein amine dehydrogenase
MKCKGHMTNMKILTRFTQVLLLLVASAAALAAQTSKEPAGIAITDPLTIAKCGTCHIPNGSGMMRRLSYIRTTPEVWEEAVKRMVRLNGLSITPAEASQVVRYLSNNNGLAPEEAKPIFWEAEHRTFRTQEDENGVPPALQRTCNYCHTLGRIFGQRRTREEYEKLANLHMAMFPGSETSVFRPNARQLDVADLPVTLSIGAAGGNPALVYPTAPAPPAKSPLDIALDYLATNQPLMTPEWSAWKAIMRPPKLADTWVINGYQKGKGRVYGKITVEATPAPDEFTTKIELHYASGQTETRTGKGIVYTGYSWRGRSKPTQTSTAMDPNYSPAETREAMFVSRDGNTMEGRWFWGGYQEFGVDVQLLRQGTEPIVLGTDLYSVPSPWTGEIRVYGANFPAAPKPADFDLGVGIQVNKVVGSTPAEATLQISVAPGLAVAMHDVSLHGATAVKAFAVYTKVDYIKVAPDADLARLGGVISAKQYAQFEAVAFSNGPDGIPGTADDVSLGPVSANWSLEEFMTTPDDDDVKYVGVINPETGLFTPSIEGPNPKRQKASNNFPTENWGDVWVDAAYKTASGQSLKARSYLVVTVPDYIQFDQPEVSQ